MWRDTDSTGPPRRLLTFTELVSLFRRPLEPVRECAHRSCRKPALSDEVHCEEHEVQHRLGYYHPETGWAA